MSVLKWSCCEWFHPSTSSWHVVPAANWHKRLQAELHTGWRVWVWVSITDQTGGLGCKVQLGDAWTITWCVCVCLCVHACVTCSDQIWIYISCLLLFFILMLVHLTLDLFFFFLFFRKTATFLLISFVFTALFYGTLETISEICGAFRFTSLYL